VLNQACTFMPQVLICKIGKAWYFKVEDVDVTIQVIHLQYYLSGKNLAKKKGSQIFKSVTL